jgi:SAM-dependent methyltransferase
MPEGKPSHPELGTQEYKRHVEEEIQHYSSIYSSAEAQESLVQPVPGAWIEVERRSQELVRLLTGNDEIGHVVKRLSERADVRLLSLGSGPCGVEIDLARRARSSSIHCIDINAQLLELGRARALSEGLHITTEVVDLNAVELPPEAFDYVFCHAGLHHLIELEHLARQIRSTLRPGGEFIVVDVITRNGYLMWPETREVVRSIWNTLPSRYRVNHTAYSEPRIDDEIWEADTSQHGMECARSQDIVRTLNETLVARQFVALQSISRRFFDTMYGLNYDLSLPLDLALFNWIWQLDSYYLSNAFLKPETFFGIYAKD